MVNVDYLKCSIVVDVPFFVLKTHSGLGLAAMGKSSIIYIYILIRLFYTEITISNKVLSYAAVAS